MASKARWIVPLLLFTACSPSRDGFDAGPSDGATADHATTRDVPSTGNDVPVTGTDVPSTGRDVPVTGTDVPSTGRDVPVTGSDVPVARDVTTQPDATSSGGDVAVCGAATACTIGSNAGCAAGLTCTPVYDDPVGLGYVYNPAGVECITAGSGAFGADCTQAGDCRAGLTCEFNVCSYYCTPGDTLPSACVTAGYQFCTQEDGDGSCWGVCDRDLHGT